MRQAFRFLAFCSRAVAALALALVTFLLLGLWGYNALVGFLDLVAARKAEGLAARDVERLVGYLRTAESAERGYLLGLDSENLAAYRRAAACTPAALAVVERARIWDPAAVARIGGDVRARLAELERAVALAGSGQVPAAVALVRAGKGRRRMARIEGRCYELVVAADRAAEARTRHLERSASALLVALPIAGALTPLVVGSALVMAVRNTRLAAEARAEADHARAEADHARAEQDRYAHLLNAISHDARTPLNAIVQQASLAGMYAAMMAAHCNRDQVIACVESIRSQAAVAKDFLDSVLETARAETQPPAVATFRLRPALESAVGLFQGEADARGLTVAVACPDDLVARTDRALLVRILVNLVGNAVKYTDRGGVAVEAGRVPDPAEPDRESDRVTIAVRDTGRGIAAADLPRIFRDFSQVENRERDARKGFGLGLSNARRMARALGGDITVVSEPGVGSTFTVTLPDLPPPPD